MRTGVLSVLCIDPMVSQSLHLIDWEGGFWTVRYLKKNPCLSLMRELACKQTTVKEAPET